MMHVCMDANILFEIYPLIRFLIFLTHFIFFSVTIDERLRFEFLTSDFDFLATNW